jgi:phospholipase/carboxylesterase
MFSSPRGPVINAEAKEGWTRVASFIDEAVNAYRADRTRVYVAGFSQGALMPFTAALTVAQMLLVSALAGGPGLEDPRTLPVLLVHGTLDEKLGVHYARSARDQLATFPLTLSYRELPIGHAVTQESVSLVGRWLSELLDAPRGAQPEESESFAREATSITHSKAFPASDPPAWMSSGSSEID